MSDKPRLTPGADGRWYTKDGYQNFLTNTGVGTGNLMDGSRYGFNPITRIRLLLEWAYRGSWIVGKAVDSVAEDMTREGVSIASDDKPEKLQQLEKEMSRLRIWKSFCQTIKLSRLYGGSIAYMMIAGQDPATPLNLESISKGQFRGLLPMDRWLLTPTLSDLVGGSGDEKEFGPEFGKPRFYNTVTDINGGVPRMKIHYTRVIRLEGVELPYWQRINENLWGESVLERLYDRLIAFDSTTVGAAQLVNKAHLRTYSVENLRQIIASGGPAMAVLTKHLNMIRAYQSNEGMTLMDAKDKFEVNQYSFSGLDSVLLQFGQQLSGALDIPLVRLFGQSPAGLNSTGESDWRNYHEGIKGKQVDAIGPGVETVYNIGYRSKFGAAPPESFEIEFNPLYLLTDEQKAEVAERDEKSISDAYEKQIIDKPTALRELRASSRVTGRFASITDEIIEQAETDEKEQRANAPSPQELGLAVPGTSGAPETAPRPRPAIVRTQA